MISSEFRYEVRYEEGQECGGGYLKLLSAGAEKNLASVQVRLQSTYLFRLQSTYLFFFASKICRIGIKDVRKLKLKIHEPNPRDYIHKALDYTYELKLMFWSFVFSISPRVFRE